MRRVHPLQDAGRDIELTELRGRERRAFEVLVDHDIELANGLLETDPLSPRVPIAADGQRRVEARMEIVSDSVEHHEPEDAAVVRVVERVTPDVVRRLQHSADRDALGPEGRWREQLPLQFRGQRHAVPASRPLVGVGVLPACDRLRRDGARERRRARSARRRRSSSTTISSTPIRSTPSSSGVHSVVPSAAATSTDSRRVKARPATLASIAIGVSPVSGNGTSTRC